MPINFKLDDAGYAHEIVRRWEIDGHEVAIIRLVGAGQDSKPENRRVEALVCECDYDAIPAAGGQGYSHRTDPNECPAKKSAQAEIKTASAVALRTTLSLHGLEEAVLRAHREIEAGRYLGQAYAEIIYVQEVAELLGKQTAEVYAAVRSLIAKEKLDVDGMILMPYVPHFRFPEEMRMMIRMMVETPIGWPNGDAGGCAISTLEAAITEATHYKNGKDLFWEHNFPHIAPSHLLEFGMHFIATAIGRGEKEDAARKSLRFTDCEQVAKWLEDTAVRFRAFGKANGFPAKIAPDDAVGAVELLDEGTAPEEGAEEDPEDGKK